jgi:hypothetical protein
MRLVMPLDYVTSEQWQSKATVKTSAPAKPIPERHQNAIPYLTVSNGSEAIAFYKAAFGAAEALCIEHGARSDMHNSKLARLGSCSATSFRTAMP